MVEYSQDFVLQQLAEGREFRTGKFYENQSSGTTITITIENPSDSDVYLHLEPIAVSSDDVIHVTPRSGVTVDTEGSDLPKVKLNGGGNYTPEGQPREGDDISGGEPFPTEFIPSGSGPFGAGGALENGFAAMIAPGQTAAQELEIINNDTDVSLTFNWVEVSKEVVPVEQ